MKRQIALSRLFSHVLFDIQYKPDSLMAEDRNKLVKEVKLRFYAKANIAFKNKLLQPEIERMTEDYFDYTIVDLGLL